MLFTFSGDYWLGLHLGMTGCLHSEEVDYSPQKHDALVLFQAKRHWFFGTPGNLGGYACTMANIHQSGGLSDRYRC